MSIATRGPNRRFAADGHAPNGISDTNGPSAGLFGGFAAPIWRAGFILSGAQVMEFSPTGSSPFQMLIGRDIICRGILTLSFDGHFTFAI